MAYVPRNLDHLNGGQSVSIYGYKTPDHVSVVLEDGYFRSCTHIQNGDMILINSDGCAPFWAVVNRPTRMDVSLIQPGCPFTKEAVDEWNALRSRAKLLGINTYAKSRDAIEKEMKEVVVAA